MAMMRWTVVFLLLARACPGAEPGTRVSAPVLYSGMCDASAAVALSDRLFAVASDEDSVIRVYARDKPGAPVQSINLASFLDLDPRSPESDLEGAARIGDRVYWITSHGRNRSGRARLSRRRFFATDIRIDPGTGKVALKMAGRPCEDLIEVLARDPRLAAFRLADASALEPKAPGALNIEGLSAMPEGGLLIGFRNPIPNGKALLVPLVNPGAVVQGKAPQLGDPLLLDLDGLGIRDMAFWEGRYLIIAGPYDGRGESRLFSWFGDPSTPHPVKHARLKGLNPEAIIFYPDKGWDDVQILSDDGKRPENGKPCKAQSNPARRHFRSAWVTL